MIREARILWRDADPRVKRIIGICWPIYAALPFVLSITTIYRITHWMWYPAAAAGLEVVAVGTAWLRIQPLWREADERISRILQEDEERKLRAAEDKRRAFEESLRQTERDLRGLDGGT